ncbi:MAG TPA: hypothetical protein VFH03_19715 [Actinoplanes sp.]|nr:hypothetical protein [Actinoplanes sp.]
MRPRLATTGRAFRAVYHPWAPAVALLAAAAAATTVTAVSAGRPHAAVWWLLIGLVSGYAISGSV